MTQLARQIKSLRQDQGYSQEDLVQKLYLSRQAISKWETGETVPDLENIVALADLFEVSLDYLILGREPEVIIKEIEVQVDKKPQTIWEFLSESWWIIPAILPWVYALLQLLKK